MSPIIISFERMKPEYKEEILKISSKIWEGDDYLQFYFDKWINDKKGEFTAILYEDKIIGCAKLTFLTETDLWFEGLRKDPDCKIHGVAKELIRYYLNKANALSKKQKITSVRFSTYIDNVASIKSNEKMGAKLINSYYYRSLQLNCEQIKIYIKNLYSELKGNKKLKDHKKLMEIRIIKNIIDKTNDNKSKDNKSKDNISKNSKLTNKETINNKLIKNELNKLQENKIPAIIKSSIFFKYSKNLFPVGWKVYPYSDDFIIDKFAKTGQFIYIEEPEPSLLLHSINKMGKLINVKIPLLIAKDINYAKLLMLNLANRLYNELCKDNETTLYFESMIPDEPFIIEQFDHLGFRKHSDKKDFLVYEYPLKMIY